MGWRLLIGLAGVLTFVGGSQHPDSSDSIPLQERMAEMTGDTGPWVIGHGLMTVGAALLVAGLMRARRADAWPTATSILPFAIVAATANAVELVLHTAAAVDHDRLVDGSWPPLTVTHLGLSLLTYPVFGIAVALLAARLLPAWPTPAKVFAVVGLLAGIANAVSTPLAIILDVDGAAALFPIAAIGISVWLVAVSLVGRTSESRIAAASSLRA